MIPSTNTQLLVAEDWKKIYQSFRNADFKSYDFETLRRTMINYLRETYPEDFNDYIDSSEYVALIDLIAFLGQNLSFRIDLNARENFLETAERRDSILRLARLINYNAKRNVPASGFLKVTSISTTENVFDSSGINLSNAVIGWNDTSNVNWYQQFVSVINAAIGSGNTFGNPAAKSIISGITTEQYKINSSNTGAPVYAFSKTLAGTPMTFELVPSAFNGTTYVYEDAPLPGNKFSLLFKNDNKGSGSMDTGFFVQFKQGAMSSSNFNVAHPVPNEVVGVNVADINDTDVWLWQLSSNGQSHQTLWTQVSALTGNNIIYNSINKNNRNIYSVLTRENDQIDLTFADGSFGNLPNGSFKLYYRQSNGLTYTIKPEQMNNITVQIPYISASGQANTLKLILSLQYTVGNSSGPESNANIRQKAPQAYYTQNRMITAEDYNIAPLSASSNIIKVKSINRVSSGISKYFELSDVSGKYSATNIFANDGILYKEDKEYNFEFGFTSRNQINSVVKLQLSKIIDSPNFYAFYLSKYERPDLSSYNLKWNQSSKTTNQTTGYFFDILNTPVSIGAYGTNYTTYLQPGALVKFEAPTGYYFLPNGAFTTVEDENTATHIWSQIVSSVGDGANYGAGNLSTGNGPVVITNVIPGDISQGLSAIPISVIPKFQNILSYSLETEIVNLCLSKRNFGLSFDLSTRAWFIIADSNLDLLSEFSLTNQKDITNSNKDSSWMVAFEWTGKKFKVRYRTTNYVFESDKETAFFIDNTVKNYDFINDTIIKDSINVLSINKKPASKEPLDTDILWQIDSAVIEPDGYNEPKKILVSFFDKNENGQFDNPDAFEQIVQPDSLNGQTGYKDKFVFFKYLSDGTRYSLVDNTNNLILSYPSEDYVSPVDGQLYYFYNSNIDVIKLYNSSTNTYTVDTTYFAKSGRSKLKFHYTHNSGDDRRLDPSKTNIIDIYLLTNTYDLEYRNWLSSGTGTEPLPPTTQSLEENYAEYLEPIKSISDEIIYHPAKYKVLFGTKAAPQLQAVFKAVTNPTRSLSASNIQSRILTAIDDFFKIENWDFGQTFNFGELSTYVMNVMDLDIINFIIVPSTDNNFGSLYQITCQSDEILVSGATVNNIIVLDSLTASELKTTSIVTN